MKCLAKLVSSPWRLFIVVAVSAAVIHAVLYYVGRV